MHGTVGVIGTVIDDRIHDLRGNVTRALGGILYTILPLRAFLPERYRVIPVMHVGHDLYERIVRLLGRLPAVETTWVMRQGHENNRVDLLYRNREDRIEISTKGVSPLSDRELDVVGELDVLIVNFISGRELSLATMKRIREIPGPMITGDLHSLLLGRREDGTRFPRRPYGWKMWLEQFDCIQMNEKELETLTGYSIKDGNHDRESLCRLISDVFFERGAGVVTVTCGERGARVFSRQGAGGRVRELRDVHPVENSLDPTGSGDVFLAAFTAAALTGRDLRSGLAFAVEAAALSTLTRGAEGLYDYFRSEGFGL
jgi:sugar/nucleoside kinase (ribokinase family)